ncbi:hypothetical protein [Rugamonas sp.]|uniref:hypothetical protein n=1 Tax=Rugamonas sp. TaxID=1926287 RepID=UPI0025D8E69B|nr:hypothetical protein [Rugamonas sp.]
MPLLTRKRAILAKIETTYGTDATPTGGANAILMSNLTVSPMEMTLVERNNIKSYLGNNPSVLAAIYAKLAFDVEMAGSGTAGTAPAYGPLLRACGLSETILATASTGTATAGSISSITLGVSASAIDGAYNGMTINLTGGADSGASPVIATYVGATKVATFTAPLAVAADVTTTYSIPAQVVYQPISIGYESTTITCVVDTVVHKLLGARGTVQIKMTAQAIPMFSFTFSGLYVDVADGSSPGVTLTGFKAPLAVNNRNTTGLVVAGFAGAVGSDMSFDFGNNVVFRSLVGGTESVIITDRKVSGSITMEATTVSAKDWWTQIKNVVLGPFSVTQGTVTGNKVKIDAPSVQLTTPAYADKDGITMLTTKADMIPANGNDEMTISFL